MLRVNEQLGFTVARITVVVSAEIDTVQQRLISQN